MEEKITFDELGIGQHLWVLIDDQILMVAKFDEYSYEVCGPWEGALHPGDCKIIELVDLPTGHEDTKLYYKKDLQCPLCGSKELGRLSGYDQCLRCYTTF